MKERNEYFDALRGGAIIAVIAIHTTGNMEYLNVTSKFYFHFAVIWRQFIGFAVPLFLTLSGYFLSHKIVNTKEYYFTFIKKQITRVYFPMLIWSLPYLLFFIYHGGHFGKSLLLYVFGGYSVFYFIILIVQYYLLLPILQQMANKKGLTIATLISALSLLLIF